MHFLILSALLHFLPRTIAAAPLFFNLTAISASNGVSVLECWQLSEPFNTSDQTGIAGGKLQQLGDVANASWLSIPARFASGNHPAPNIQYVAFLSGLTHLTIPNSRQEAWILGGKYGLILAADTATVSKEGHNSIVGNDEVTGLQIPTADGKIPRHKVLYQEPCRWNELSLL